MKSPAERCLEFDPNDQSNLWSVYSPGKGWKVYGKLQYALSSSAFRSMTNCVRLFENVDGEWVERARRIDDLREPFCDVCGGSTAGKDAWNVDRNMGVWWLDRDHNGRLVKPLVNLFICRSCEKRRLP